MSRKCHGYLFSLVLSMAPLSTWCAQNPGPADDSLHQKWWAQLNLTDDQKAKLKALRIEAKGFRKANFETMKSIIDKSKEELLKAAPSKAVLYEYAKKIGELHRAMSEHMADQILKMKSILTKEQFEKFITSDFGPLKPPRGPHPPHGGPHGLGPPPPDNDE